MEVKGAPYRKFAAILKEQNQMKCYRIVNVSGIPWSSRHHGFDSERQAAIFLTRIEADAVIEIMSSAQLGQEPRIQETVTEWKDSLSVLMDGIEAKSSG